MLRGDRGIFAAIVGWLIFACYALTESQAQQQNAIRTAKAAEQSRERPQQADTDRAGIFAPFERLISNPEPDEGTEREKRDLAAQEATAVWTFWVVMIGFAQLVLSGFGLMALIRTIKQGDKGLRRARKANKIASDALIAEARPWITIIDFEVDPLFITKTVDEQLYASVTGVATVKNIGKLPASGFRDSITAVAMRDSFDNDPSAPFSESPQRKGHRVWPDTLAPGEERRLHFHESHPANYLLERGNAFCVRIQLIYRSDVIASPLETRQIWTVSKEVKRGQIKSWGESEIVWQRRLPAQVGLRHTFKMT